MTTSSEDVLLQIGQVRYKKGDGTLYVMNERLAWMVDHRDMVSVSHRYTDIKLQKISPEGKPKIQLQVVLHDGSASTFHFVNHEGVAAQLKDRDNVKELLQQLLQKFKREVNKELEEKNRLLSENPALLQLYRDLVITQVISPEEFWSQHATQYTQKQQAQKQEVGVSGAFLADIKPQTDGCNGLRYNLTADIIECIFKTYPAVRKKHLEYVPHKLSESEFWTKFFQSHYFHRDRINTGTKDLFTECAKLDDQELKRDINAGIDDPMVDIASFEDQTLDDGYGAGMDKTAISQSGNIVHQMSLLGPTQLSRCYANDKPRAYSRQVVACKLRPGEKAIEHWGKQKAVTKKELAAQKRHALDTGGGPPRKIQVAEEVIAQVLLIQPGLDDEVESLDSDYHQETFSISQLPIQTLPAFQPVPCGSSLSQPAFYLPEVPTSAEEAVYDPYSEPPSAAAELVQSQAERPRKSEDGAHKRLFQLKEEKEVEFQGLGMENRDQ
uniref:General transcription factor IIH subunit 1 n=1 Tax=Timema bartmani TaxID=61472 RepID=A0A7R9HVQ1_9NEOP|nr:unnamed protein product [Timema bartmani]